MTEVRGIVAMIRESGKSRLGETALAALAQGRGVEILVETTSRDGFLAQGKTRLSGTVIQEIPSLLGGALFLVTLDAGQLGEVIGWDGVVSVQENSGVRPHDKGGVV